MREGRVGNSNRIYYYSLVGLRAVPVCMPLYQLLKDDSTLYADATLVCTDVSRDVANISDEFFRKEFGERVRVDVVTYDRFLSDLKTGAVQSSGIINLSPGMNWQVSEVVLHLPDEFQCINIDYRHIYRYPLNRGIEDADVMEMKYNLGLENYNILNPDLQVVRDENPKRDTALRKIAGGDNFKIRLKESHPYLSWINYSLVLVQERRGFLYLLFDITDRGQHESLKMAKIGNHALCLYRLINATFDHINYSVTFLSDNHLFNDRAAYDGVYIINGDNAIDTWLKNPPEPKKTPMRGRGVQKQLRIKGKMKRVLLLSIGDNILPTLKAVKSHRVVHKIDTTVVFYDEASERIKSIANKMKDKSLKYGNMELLPTNHMGTGILEKMKGICCRQGAEYFINITPGTKAQAVALSAGASTLGLAHRVFSIKKERLCKVISGEDVGKVEDVLPDEVIDFYCFHHQGNEDALNGNLEKNKDLWDDILKGLATGRYKYQGRGLMGICKGKRGSVLADFKRTGAEYSLYHKEMEKQFFLPPEVFSKEEDLEEGWWWEIATFHAISKHGISDKVVLNIQCYPKPDRRRVMSEIDLAFTYRGQIVAVSCKTHAKSLKLHAYQLLAEARNRFGRMAVCLLAIPLNDVKEYVSLDEKGERVYILTPPVLNDKEILVDTINKQINLLSTIKD